MAEIHRIDEHAARQRRPAVVVAVDAAGYSRQSEIDEAVAVREITAVGERIRASAASHGGRVFNTAGDGFMLEFPTAASAVAAAEEIQSVERVPLRIGVHLGEVHETPARDLLGKGVNVAARLMQAAQPGNMLISEEVKNGLAEEVAARLQRIGRVRLDKMQERIEAYALGSPWKRPATIPLRWAIAGAGALVLLLIAVFAAPALLSDRSHAIAVLEFRTTEPAVQGFAAGLADRLIGALSTNDLQAVHTSATADEDRVAAAARAGAAFVLDGSARTEGADMLVNARLIDTRGNIALWSHEYRRIASEQSYMQEQIAFDVARVLRCALVSLEPRGGVDSATLAVFMRACQSRGGADFTDEEGYQAAREVTERASRFSRGWSMRAIIAAEMSQSGLPPEETQALVADARDSAARARRLDSSNSETYLVEATLLPARDFRGRQALITQALEKDPDLAAAHALQAWLYADVGRSHEALRAMQRAVAIEPLNADYVSSLPPAFNAVRDFDAAQEILDRLYRIYPESPEAWYTRLMNSTYNGDPAEGLRMLENIDSAPPGIPMRGPVVPRWRAFLLARQSGDAARMRRAALSLRELIPGQFGRSPVGSALSLAGEVDAALEVAAPVVAYGGAGSFFLPPWRNMRRDPRFMDLIKDTGLIEYWRETGRWADFCRERDLPYDCETEAARVLPP